MPRRPWPTSEELVTALVSHGAELGRSPHKLEFQARTHFTERHIKSHFKSWNQLLIAANLKPNVIRNATPDELLDDWGNATRKFGHVPIRAEYCVEGKYGANTFLRRFDSWAGIGRAFFQRSSDDPHWQDVIQIIRDREACHIKPWLISPDYRTNLASSPTARSSTPAPSPNGIAYGDPLDFKFLRNAPTNEAGVVYLFGCLAPRLGFIVEAVQPGFPDCEAKRKDAEGKLRRLRIEFEYESKNFHHHKHDITACDIIVCWHNNWPECPLEVIELSKELEALKNTAA